MFYFRKSFGNVWKTVKLSKEEFADVELKTASYVFRAYRMISKLADDAKIELAPVVKAAMLIFFAMKLESFSNDKIESNAIKEAQEAAKSEAEKQTPEVLTTTRASRT